MKREHTIRQSVLLLAAVWLLLISASPLPAADEMLQAELQPHIAKRLQALREEIAANGYTFTVGYSPAMDRPIEQLCGLKPPPAPLTGQESTLVAESTEPALMAAGLPASFDWRDRNGLTPVKDQASCGGCWAFGTVGPLESQIKLKCGITVDLSEQYLISCNLDGYSCANGGWWAHDYHLNESGRDNNGPGAVLEADDQFKATDSTCGGPYTHHYRINSWSYVGNYYSVPSVQAIKQAIYNHGPISAAIYTGSKFNAYSSGIFNSNESGTVNHAIVLVGWNDDLGTDNGYWILRNSWGPYWGESGYMKIRYGTSQVGYGAAYIDFTCPNAPTTVPTVGTPVYSSVSTTSATLGATITAGLPITSAGIAYGTNPNPTSGTGAAPTPGLWAYTVDVSSLSPNTLYHFRGYASNAIGISYTADTPFTTVPTAPSTSTATGITSTGFSANWTVPSGTATITGYQLDVSTNSSFSSFVTGYNNLSVTGTNQAVSGLSAGTTYYYRVRAVNAGGTSVSSGYVTVTIPTAVPPTIDTPTSSSVGTASATLGAIIESNGGSTVTGSGVAYGTAANPTTAGTKVTSGTTGGTFSVNATGLASNTLYHYRGYASNSVGIGYTADATFTTVPGAPTALVATSVNVTGFTANWSAPSGTAAISSYLLDVSTSSSFSSYVSGYNGAVLAGTGSTSAVSGLTAGRTYYYRVRAVNAGGTSTYSSVITVALPGSGLSVTTPAGGVYWPAGSSQTISWTYAGTPGSNVKIELLKEGSLVSALSSNTTIGSGGAGSWTWAISPVLPGGSDYQIRVTSTSDGTATSTSQQFVLVKDLSPVLELLLSD